MNCARFDELVRTVTRGTPSRRTILSRLAGGVLGAGLAAPGPNHAAAQRCERHADCPGVELCCDGNCTDADRDDDHCGRCGHKCTGRRVCCGGKCVDLLTNEFNCGRCRRVCRRGHCRDGHCEGEPDCIPPGDPCLLPPGEGERCCEPSFCKDVEGERRCCRRNGDPCTSPLECCEEICERGECGHPDDQEPPMCPQGGSVPCEEPGARRPCCPAAKPICCPRGTGPRGGCCTAGTRCTRRGCKEEEPPACPPGADSCSGTTVPCGTNCACFLDLDDRSVCASNRGCGACTSDAECAFLRPDAICIKCAMCTLFGGTACALPCPTPG